MAELPLFLQEQTEELIMQRMLDRVPSDIDKSEGSFIWDTQAPVAFALSEAAIWAQQVLERGFASTTYGEYLDHRVAEHGVSRRAAVAARGQITLTGVSGQVVPKGTILATLADELSGEASMEYVTGADVTLNSEGLGTVSATAVVPGKQGNVPSGVITIMPTPIQGISTITNEKEFSGGADIESDEALLERFYARVRNQGTSGNKAHYMLWATEIPGVGGVQVQPLWQGAGTVGIYVIDTDKRAANVDIVHAVQQYIDPSQDGSGEGMAPAGAITTVMPATEVPINISVQLTLAKDATLEDVKAQIQKGVTSYLKQLAFQDSLVRITRIAAVLLDIPPITDYSGLTVNGSSESNIEIPFGQVAVLGEVNVHE
ncbi:Baseplate J-like protein [compost metagenome]